MNKSFLMAPRCVIRLAVFLGFAISVVLFSKIIWAQEPVPDILRGEEAVECVDAPDRNRWRPRDWQLVSERILVFRMGRGDMSTYFLNVLQTVCDASEFRWADAEPSDYEMHFADSFGSGLWRGREVCADDWIVSRRLNSTGRILPSRDCQLGAFRPIDATLGEQLLRAKSIAEEIVEALAKDSVN